MKTMPAILSTAIACLCLSTASLVQAEPSRTQAYADCTNKIEQDLAQSTDPNIDPRTFRNFEWIHCAEQEVARQDVVLNSEYRALRNTLSNAQKEAMLKGQRAWLKYREDWCRFEEDGQRAPGGAVSYLSCILDITDQQIDRIQVQNSR